MLYPRKPLRPARVPVRARASERSELLSLLVRDGILRPSATQKIYLRDGSEADTWMLNTLAISMTERGARLAARAYLKELARFEGRQLATYGVTAIPLMQAIVLESGGAYRGLVVRKELKTHGSRKRIEGAIDLDEPVILIDDSISSGFSTNECWTHVREAGLWAEGAVSLVSFGWDDGPRWLTERGLPTFTVFDIWRDLIPNMPNEVKLPANPTKVFPELRFSGRAPNRAHPCALARLAISQYLAHGTVPNPPAALDRDYDARGGIYVSLRSKRDIHERYARDGSWHFPGEAVGSNPRELILSALLTADELRRKHQNPRALLADSHLAVTFFSALEACTVGELDNDQNGIVVVSGVRPTVMGGALPRMPGIRTEQEQFHHARVNNAQLSPLEPYVLYQHGVEKVVEPGVEWQPTGVPRADTTPWWDDAKVCAPLAERALALLREEASEPVAGPPPGEVHELFVTLYRGGTLFGCIGLPVGESDFDRVLRQCVNAALHDLRFDRPEEGEYAVSVSLLHHPLDIGECSVEEIGKRFVLGEHALVASQNERSGLLLPFTAMRESYSHRQFAEEVIDKAGITRPPYFWRRYECATWLAREGASTVKLVDGLPAGPREKTTAKVLLAYLLRPHRAKEPRGTYLPFIDSVQVPYDAARWAHQAWTFARAGRVKEASEICAALKPQTLAESAFVLLAACEGAKVKGARALAAALWAQIGRHGAFDGIDAENLAYAPNQALLALARACEAGLCKPDPVKAKRALRFSLHRFRTLREFGAVSWLTQALCAWHRVLGESAHADAARELVDWVLQFQSKKHGGFFDEQVHDAPGFTTGVYLEAVAAVWRLTGERRYRDAFERGMRFVDRLVYQRNDAAILPNPEWAYGGVRGSLVASDVRPDFVQHALMALLELEA